jgi:putative sigma-54 modulation protein
MNLNLTGRHVEITPAMHNYVTAKMVKIKRHFDNVIDINVTLSVEKLSQNAEANVHVRGKNIFVETNSNNMYASIDNLVDKLDRKILKHKEKNAAHHNNSALKNQIPEQPD